MLSFEWMQMLYAVILYALQILYTNTLSSFLSADENFTPKMGAAWLKWNHVT